MFVDNRILSVCLSLKWEIVKIATAANITAIAHPPTTPPTITPISRSSASKVGLTVLFVGVLVWMVWAVGLLVWNVVLLDWTIGLLVWTATLLVFTVGLLVWKVGPLVGTTGLLVWTIGVVVWAITLRSWAVRLLVWTIGLVVWGIGLLVWYVGVLLVANVVALYWSGIKQLMSQTSGTCTSLANFTLWIKMSPSSCDSNCRKVKRVLWIYTLV